jgi:hypothetical protein
MAGRFRFVRENAFLVAAVLLPLVVIGFFLIAAAVPRWLVAPPAHDVLLRAAGPYDQSRRPFAVDFTVREGRVQATVRALPAGSYPQVAALLLVDHETLAVREIPIDLPGLAEADHPVTVPIASLAGWRVLAETRAPDGYELDTRGHRGTGLIGDLFGMHRYDEKVSLVKNGRVVPISLPSREYGYPVSVVGWVVVEGAH